MIRLLLFVLAFAVPAHGALACACCADRADRLSQTLALDDGTTEEFARLRSIGSTWVHTTACSFDCVKGLEWGRHTYELNLTIWDGAMHLETADGVMRLPLGQKVEHFAVDPDPFSEGNTPMLYREFRFAGAIEGSGKFSHIDGAEARLVLAGEGNSCWVASDFKHWSLSVSGENVDFKLYGQLFTGDE